MIIDFLQQGGYGQYIWPAFVFAFASCVILFLKTRKDLRRQEKLFFNEHEQFDAVEIETVSKIKHGIKEKALSSSSI